MSNPMVIGCNPPADLITTSSATSPYTSTPDLFNSCNTKFTPSPYLSKELSRGAHKIARLVQEHFDEPPYTVASPVSEEGQKIMQREFSFIQDHLGFNSPSHKWICSFYDTSYCTDQDVRLVMPYYNQGDLSKTYRKLSSPELEEIVENIAESVKALHRRKIIHRDIKLENIFVHSEEGETHGYLGDFAFAHLESKSCQEIYLRGSEDYMAPELLQAYNTDDFSAIDTKVDIYAIGILFEAISKRKRFSSPRQIARNRVMTLKRMIPGYPTPHHNSSDRLEITALVQRAKHILGNPSCQQDYIKCFGNGIKNSALTDIIQHCCHPDPKKRWNAEQFAEAFSCLRSQQAGNIF
ncbi:MAG: protein kinase domain-containing protein [Chlamydiota bacterium]